MKGFGSVPGDTVPWVFVSDLRHFLDLPHEAPGPARRMAEHLTLIVRAATAGEAGSSWVSALCCKRRPSHRACPGYIEVLRADVPPSIQWRCTSCGDEGVISGWEESPFDLRARRVDDRDGSRVLAVVVDADVAATLRSLMLLDTTSERLVFRARPAKRGVTLRATEDDLEELIGYVAAEANNEEDRRRQKHLDTAFEALNEALTGAG
jgi:hypothetical protein